MAPAIPDRWLDYTPIGKKVKGTRFIAFKVPLREHVVENVPQDNRLTCHSLLTQVPNLGLIIDLTNTKRYYDPIFFKDNGVKYEKLMIPGREIPPAEFVKTFKMFVNNFLQENSNNSKLIGVHCTHGVNRTGYLISSFMISELKMKPQDAIKSVENARGHDIERRNYINHLTVPISSSTNLQNHDNQEPPFGKWRQRHYRDRPSCYQRPFPNHEDSRNIRDSGSIPNQYKYDNNNRGRPSGYQRPLPRHNVGTNWRSFPNREGSRDIRDIRSLPNQYKYDNKNHDRSSGYQRPFPNHEDSRDIRDSRSLPDQYKYDNNNLDRPSCYQGPLPRHNVGTNWRSFPNHEDSRGIRDSRSLPHQYKYDNRFHIMNQNRNQS